MKYTGNKEFKTFFQYLSSQDTSRRFDEIDTSIIQNFIDDIYPVTLPAQYIEFMRYAGNGQFWEGSMYKFSDVKYLKGHAEELLADNDFPVKLKDSDFVFWMHGGYMFYFFNLDEGDDPPVYYYSECEEMSDFVRCSNSFTDFVIDPYITGTPVP